MLLVDSHCHLQDSAFDRDRAQVLKRAQDNLAWLLVVGSDLESSFRAVDMARAGVYAAVGIHPHEAEALTPEVLTSIADLAGRSGIVAVGEIGLDYHYMRAPKDVQRRALISQLELAARLQLPVVIHNRDSDEDLRCVVKDFVRALRGGVMHCFAGGPAFAERCLEWGFYISFAGNVTFPNAAKLREAAKRVPLDKLLVETDAPYLAPQPVRGRRCEPIYARYTAEALANVKGVPLDDLTRRTTENACRLFCVEPAERSPET